MPKRSNPAFWLMTLGNGGTPVLFNEAVGGTVTEIADYNGTGETWRVHTFTSSGSLEVLNDADPDGFRVLVAGGGGGGGVSMANGGGGGAAGQLVINDTQALTVGTHTVTVGARGNHADNVDWGAGKTGGQSKLGSITANGGGGGGGGAGWGGDAHSQTATQAAYHNDPVGWTESNITGTMSRYCHRGCPGAPQSAGLQDSAPGSGGGGAGSGWGDRMAGIKHGIAGIVIVAYQIG